MRVQTLVPAIIVGAVGLLLTLDVIAADKTSNNVVVIQNFNFAPKTLRVHTGTRVTWINKDGQPHTITSVDKTFHSGHLPTHKDFAFTFNKPGTYEYFCSIHPYMRGTVVVGK